MPTPSRVDSHEPESDSSASFTSMIELCRGEALASIASAAKRPANALESPGADCEEDQPECEECDEERALHADHRTRL